MNDQSPKGNTTYAIKGNLLEGKISSEYGPDFFSTDEKTAKILLMKYHEAIRRQADWITLAGTAIALLSPFITSDFKNFLSIDSRYWEFLFAIGIALCIIKMINSLISTIIFYDDANIEKVVANLRAGNTKIGSPNTLLWLVTWIKQRLTGQKQP